LCGAVPKQCNPPIHFPATDSARNRHALYDRMSLRARMNLPR
jgi:hypothetical protein